MPCSKLVSRDNVAVLLMNRVQRFSALPKPFINIRFCHS